MKTFCSSERGRLFFGLRLRLPQKDGECLEDRLALGRFYRDGEGLWK